jgi:hypothetical protein
VVGEGTGPAPNGPAPNGPAPNGPAPNGQAPNKAEAPTAISPSTRCARSPVTCVHRNLRPTSALRSTCWLVTRGGSCLAWWTRPRSPTQHVSSLQLTDAVPDQECHDATFFRQRLLDQWVVRHSPIAFTHVFSHTSLNSAGFGDAGT